MCVTSHFKHDPLVSLQGRPIEVRDVMCCRPGVGKAIYFQVLPPTHPASRGGNGVVSGELHNFWWIKEAPTWPDVEVQLDSTSTVLQLNVWETFNLQGLFGTQP